MVTGLCGWRWRQSQDAVAHLGVQVVREDIRPEMADDEIETVIADFTVSRGVHPLWLIAGGHGTWPDGQPVTPHGVAELAMRALDACDQRDEILAAPWGIEILNEPDLAHPHYARHPERFAEAVRLSRDALRGAGYDGHVVSGGVSNLNGRGISYLATALKAGLPDDVVIGFHRYPRDAGPTAGHFWPSRSREGEWQRFRAVVGDRRLACTECGYGRHRKGNGRRWTEQEQADHTRWELDFLAGHGVELATIYQIASGSDDSDEQYGVLREDGTETALAETIRLWCAPPSGVGRAQGPCRSRGRGTR